MADTKRINALDITQRRALRRYTVITAQIREVNTALQAIQKIPSLEYTQKQLMIKPLETYMLEAVKTRHNLETHLKI